MSALLDPRYQPYISNFEFEFVISVPALQPVQRIKDSAVLIEAL